MTAGGKPTVRKAQLPGREQDDLRSERRWPKGGRKPRRRGRLLLGGVVDNWPDTGPGARLRKQADAGQVSP